MLRRTTILALFMFGVTGCREDSSVSPMPSMEEIQREASEAREQAGHARPLEVVFIETELTSRESANAVWRSMYEKYGLPAFVTGPGEEMYWNAEPRNPGSIPITRSIYDGLLDRVAVNQSVAANWTAVGAPEAPTVVAVAIDHSESWSVKLKELYEVLPDGTKVPVTKDTWSRR